MFDGHGGVKASRFASENLHKNLRDKILKGNNSMYSFQVSLQGFFRCSQGPKFGHIPFSPIFQKKNHNLQKKNFF